MLADGVGQGARCPQENAAIPVVAAGEHELLCPLPVGLLGKAADALDAVRQHISGLDVAVPGLWPDRLHPQHHDVFAGCGQGDALLDGGPILLLIGDHVVGGEDAQHRIGSGALDEESRQARCGRGVARRRLTDDLLPQHGLQLLGDGLGEQVVGDHPKLVRGGQRSPDDPRCFGSWCVRHPAPGAAWRASGGSWARSVFRCRRPG